MSDDRLFDPGPAVIEEPEEDLSADRKITQSNKRQLARGVHPATLCGLDPDESHKCGNCAHHLISDGHAKRYHKCELHRLGLSQSAASDIRVSWPGCRHWMPE